MPNFLLIDTETMNASPDDKKNLLVYDLGMAVINEQGKILVKHSYIINECFFNMADIMQTAYYASKIPLYNKEIQEGKRIVIDFLTAFYRVREIIKNYKIEAVVAHNMIFDLNALNNTLRYITKSELRYFFPYNIKIYDTLKMARSVWGKTPKYKRYCTKNNYLTAHKKPQPRFTAEILYKYITKNENFKEAHTGLEDVLIEKYIFVACYNSKRCNRKELFEKK